MSQASKRRRIVDERFKFWFGCVRCHKRWLDMGAYHAHEEGWTVEQLGGYHQPTLCFDCNQTYWDAWNELPPVNVFNEDTLKGSWRSSDAMN